MQMAESVDSRQNGSNGQVEDRKNTPQPSPRASSSSAAAAPTAAGGGTAAGSSRPSDSNEGTRSEFTLEIDKLHALATEQQDLYLYNFVTRLEQHLLELNVAELNERQQVYKQELFKVVELATPSPTRAVRNTLGRCFTALLSRGNRKILFPSINELGELISNSGKSDKGARNRHAAAYCLGEIYRVAGDSATQLSPLACSILTKLYKSSSSHVGVRAAALRALGKIIIVTDRFLDETVARDIWKQSRNALSGDKAFVVQINAAWAIEKLVGHTKFFDNPTDFESLKGTVWKSFDSPSPVVRHAIASCFASVLVKAYSEEETKLATASGGKPKKASKRQSIISPKVPSEEDDEDVAARAASPTPSKKAPIVLELSLHDILRQLSVQYVRSATNNRGRAMLVVTYEKLLRRLKVGVVEANLPLIADHLLIEVLNNSVILYQRYRLLITRRFVHKILAEVIGQKILGESGQLAAAKLLISDVLKNYPRVLKEKLEPSKNTLTGTLDVLASLIKSLGSAFTPLADSCRDTLAQVLQHPSYTVQVHASYCLRHLSAACPHQLLSSASLCLNSLQHELGNLQTDRTANRKCVGYANGVAAVLGTSNMHPIYGSLEVTSKVLQQAVALLKSAASSELRVSGTQVQVAFILIGGLMSLGPNFVKIHLVQLLQFWKNALPKPVPKENAKRKAGEISYLLLIRECALGSVLTFLEFNGRLLTPDVSKRVATMLQSTVEFLDDLPSIKADKDTGSGITPSLTLHDLVQMTRRRVLQCLTRLAIYSPVASSEILSQSTLISFALDCFAEPDFGKVSLGTSIATSAGNFDSIWDMGDNSGFGVSGLLRGFKIRNLPGEKSTGSDSTSPWYSKSMDEADALLLSPVCGAKEHDSAVMFLPEGDYWQDRPDPPATEVVNSAINFFSMALPLQDHKIQESVMEQLVLSLSSKNLAKEPGRRAAIVANTSLALLGAVRVSLGETSASPGSMKVGSVRKRLEDLLRNLVIDPDQYVRSVAAQALGRLCSSAGNESMNSIINGLVETIIQNRDSNARAGCATALGQIHANVGGMAAGFHLRTIHQVLMSLCSDTHPTVHFWAIEALSQVAEAAGLTFSSYMHSTLGLLAQLWISDTHSAESDLVGTSNAEVDLPSAAAIASSVASLISVLGPDLQDMAKPRELIMSLLGQFEVDESVLVQGKSLECWGHIFLYAPSYVDLRKYVGQLQSGLEQPELNDVSSTGLLNLMQKNALAVVAAASDGLDEVIWSQLSDPTSDSTIKKILQTWVEQTSLVRTSYWITRYQTILTRTTSKPDAATEAKTAEDGPSTVDEEVAGFNVGQSKDQDEAQAAADQELLGWRIRAFALECLGQLFAACAKDLENNPDSKAGTALQLRLSEIIRLAFLASTDQVVALRVRGLHLIDQVLRAFGNTPDPDFSEALLLEQYQAQISSALTPAFSSDSSPELASSAVGVCATFIATGLVKDVERMGRILKLLVSSLTSLSDKSQGPVIGDLKGLSSNAQTMVKMAVLSGWAELQVSSSDQVYLKEVVQPYVEGLTPQWLESLQEFARLRFEPDISSNMSSTAGDSLDVIYAAYNRETLLKFYQDTWLIIVDAIASLIDQDSGFVFAALDKKDTKITGAADAKIANLDYRDEPVAFFFVLFGIAFEALMTRSETDPSKIEAETLEILQAMRKILRPAVAGHAIYGDQVFSEAVELLGRLALTEGLPVRQAVVDISRSLCLSHPTAGTEQAEDLSNSEYIDQLFQLTKIIALVLTGMIPNMSEDSGIQKRYDFSVEAISLIVQSLNALVDVAKIYPQEIRADLYACIINIVTTILGTGACQETVVPRVLPVFKRFVTLAVEDVEEIPTVADQLRNCLARFRAILARAQRRENEASLPCARNTLLAATMLLTSSGGSAGGTDAAMSATDPLLTGILDDLLECLSDVGLGRVAAGCVRGILLLEPKGDTAQVAAAYALPRALHFILDTESYTDPEGARGVIVGALCGYAGQLDDRDAGLALTAILVPLVLALARSESAGPGGKEKKLASSRAAAARLLTLASADAGAFRTVMGSLDQESRAHMEQVMREGGLGAGRGDKESEQAAEPTIALKLDFGSS